MSSAMRRPSRPPTPSPPAHTARWLDTMMGKMLYAGKYSRENVAGCRREGSTPPPGGSGHRPPRIEQERGDGPERSTWNTRPPTAFGGF